MIPGGKTDPVGVVSGWASGVKTAKSNIWSCPLWRPLVNKGAVESAVTENELVTFTKNKTMFTQKFFKVKCVIHMCGLSFV